VQVLAGTPAREPTPVPALKHITKQLHHDGWEPQLSPKRDRHLARRTHLERDVVPEQRGVLARMPAPNRTQQRRQERGAVIRRVELQNPRQPIGGQARAQPTLEREPRGEVGRQRKGRQNVNQPGAFGEHAGAVKARSPLFPPETAGRWQMR
jgi:hypothetical protein